MKVIDKKLISDMIPKRKSDTNKGDFGCVLNIAGNTNYSGAAALSCLGALRAGAGIVTLASTETVITRVAALIPEATFLPLSEENGVISKTAIAEVQKQTENCNTVLIGCGIGISADTVSLVGNIVTSVKTPIIIDADGLNIISRNLDILKHKKSDLILTPHPKEFSRLSGLSVDYIAKNREQSAKDFAKTHGIYLLLKGKGTITATPNGEVFCNATGNAGMAKGGSGDILAGMIAGFTAQKIPLKESCIIATYIHGLAGDIAKSEYTEISMLPTDIVNAIPKAFKFLTKAEG